MLKIEAVTVSVGYGDFLAVTAPFVRPLVDRWIVVTTPDDSETRSVCRACSIECLTTEEHRRDGEFSKGRMIDRGFALLGGNDWMLHLDADIVLPHDFHQVIEEAHLDEQCIYGCDRLNVTGWDAWQRVKANGLWARNSPWAVDLYRPDTTIGTRVANQGHGFTPIGFWQMWSARSSIWRDFHMRRYPAVHGSAARSDVQHSLQWDRRKRVLIPELLVWHLESEASAMGVNWKGRKSTRFGPPTNEKSSGKPEGLTTQFNQGSNYSH